jgi:hypothetical protein
VYAYVCSGLLHGWLPLSNSLQLKVLQCLSWLKEELQRHSSSTDSGEFMEALGTGDKACHGPAAHWDHAWSLQPCLAWLTSPMAIVMTGGGYMPPRLGSTSPAPGTKKWEGDHHLWYHSTMPKQTIFCKLLCPPPLTHFLACLSAMPVCPSHPTPILTHASLTPEPTRG